MKYYVETSLENFKPWGQAATSRLNALKEHDMAFNTISDQLDEYTSQTECSETDINDFIAYDMDEELLMQGFYDPDTDKWYDDGSFDPDAR